MKTITTSALSWTYDPALLGLCAEYLKMSEINIQNFVERLVFWIFHSSIICKPFRGSWSVRWSRELDAVQLKKAHANRQNTRSRWWHAWVQRDLCSPVRCFFCLRFACVCWTLPSKVCLQSTRTKQRRTPTPLTRPSILITCKLRKHEFNKTVCFCIWLCCDCLQIACCQIDENVP